MWKRNHSLPEQMERGLIMNENWFRPAFDRMDAAGKQALMESLAARYQMTFLGLHTFDRWGQSCTTGVFEKDGREFVFVPGDTVTLGWERFAVGLDPDSRKELDDLFQEWEIEQAPEELVRAVMAPCARRPSALCWWGESWRSSAGSRSRCPIPE